MAFLPRLDRSKLGKSGDTKSSLQGCRLQTNWRGAISRTLESARADEHFQTLVKQADASRDARNWSDAETYYHEALQLYPLHRGYYVQYAHTMKEQGKFLKAETYYRSAFSLGVCDADLRRHLGFVAQRNGSRVSEGTLQNIETYWGPVPVGVSDSMMRPPIYSDVLNAYDILIGHRNVSLEQVNALLDTSPTLENVFAAIIRSIDFEISNRRLLFASIELGL